MLILKTCCMLVLLIVLSVCIELIEVHGFGTRLPVLEEEVEDPIPRSGS